MGKNPTILYAKDENGKPTFIGQLSHDYKKRRKDKHKYYCTNPVCGGELIARKTNRGLRREHFAHKNNTILPGCRESALHMLAKETLREHYGIMLPTYIQGKTVVNGYIKGVTNWELEKTKRDKNNDIVIKADAYAKHTSYGEIIVEIKVSHGVNIAKQKKIEALGISTIEIDLSKLKDDYTKQDVIDILTSETLLKRWVYTSNETAQRLLAESYRKDYKSELDIIMNGRCPMCGGKMWLIDTLDLGYTLYCENSKFGSEPKGCTMAMKWPDCPECSKKGKYAEMARQPHGHNGEPFIGHKAPDVNDFCDYSISLNCKGTYFDLGRSKRVEAEKHMILDYAKARTTGQIK